MGQLYTAEQIAPGIWTFTWTALPDSVYEIWLEGILLETTAAGVGTYTTTKEGPTDYAPPVEIHDTLDGLAESEEYASRAILQWRGMDGPSGYRNERIVNGGWQPVNAVTERNAGWYIFNTGLLVDQEATRFRVMALDDRGLPGDAVEFTVAVVCNPAPPVTTTTVVGGNLEVSI